VPDSIYRGQSARFAEVRRDASPSAEIRRDGLLTVVRFNGRLDHHLDDLGHFEFGLPA
jgi:hypothetical protein